VGKCLRETFSETTDELLKRHKRCGNTSALIRRDEKEEFYLHFKRYLITEQ
jgi:hypothetical protein